MPVTRVLSHPGVYVEEVSSGARTIAGVPTSIAMFAGASADGPVGAPLRCSSFKVFRDTFGDDASAGELSESVRLFFLNGGADCWVMRMDVDAGYDAAFESIDREVDLFNLLVLPPAAGGEVPVEVLARASAFCRKRRAFLLMDSPADWSDARTAVAGVAAFREGLVRDHCAVFYPRITVEHDGVRHDTGASGAMAGIFARMERAHGVWKAPAGSEADVRGVVGLATPVSQQDGALLNPRAINALRSFPGGIYCWGARTNQGDDLEASDYKYIPVRRLSSFIAESLDRGLKWVAFETHGERSWAQVRLSAGAFLHGLWLQGAFQGRKAEEAYFVRCDATTTTQDDLDRGVLNVVIGFAPLRPAEFVILSLQQRIGQGQ